MLTDSQSRNAGIRIIVGLVLAGITTLTVLMPILPDLLQLRSQFQAIDGNEPGVIGPEGFHAFLQLAGAWIWWAAVPGFILAAVGIARCIEAPHARRALVACMLGGALAIIFTVLGGSWIYARFLLYLVVGSTLLIGLGVLLLAQRGPAWSAILATTILAGAWILDLATRPPKQPIREAVAWLRQRAESTGEHRALSIGLMDDVATYYAQPLGMELIKTGSLGSDLPPLHEAPDLVIALYPDRLAPDVEASLETAGYTESRRFQGWLDWDHGDVVVLERKNN